MLLVTIFAMAIVLYWKMQQLVDRSNFLRTVCIIVLVLLQQLVASLFTSKSQVNLSGVKKEEKNNPIINQFSFLFIVPTPQLKYLLSGHLHVIWQENETIGYNYTAHICCSKLWPFPYSGCPNTCPQFQAMTSCTSAGSGSDSKSRQCSMMVYEYFEYTVYLSGKQHGCQLMGKMVKIRPRARSK